MDFTDIHAARCLGGSQRPGHVEMVLGAETFGAEVHEIVTCKLDEIHSLRFM